MEDDEIEEVAKILIEWTPLGDDAQKFGNIRVGENL